MKKQYNRAEFAQRYAQVSRELGGGIIVVSSGGALLMLGLRQTTSDLDLDVPEAVFNKHRTPENTEMFGQAMIVNYADDVALHVLKFPQGTQVVKGVRIYDLVALIEQKKSLIANPNRNPEKLAQDHADLKALEAMRPRRASSSW